MALPGVQRSRFEVGVNNKLHFPRTELEVPMVLQPHGEHQQEPGYCGLELETDEQLPQSVNHRRKNGHGTPGREV